MRNMSKEFYDYLANRIYDFFNKSLLNIGDKFILNLDNSEDVELFYKAFDKLLSTLNKKMLYDRPEDENFKTYQFECDSNSDIRVVVVSEKLCSNAYMTNLRNTIPSEKGVLFMISSNPNDSISGANEDLKKEGMPLHKDKIIEDLETKIKKSSLPDGKKQILSYALEENYEGNIMDTYSLMDYADIITILSKEKFSEDDFYKFEMFSDEEITTFNIFDKKVIKDRIKDNQSIFKKINDIVKYGNPKDDLDGYIDKDEIKQILNNTNSARWDQNITYSKIKESHAKATKKQETIKILGIEIIADGVKLSENREFYVRYEKENTETGKRKPQILIFNNIKAKTVIISIEFSNSLGSNNPSIDDKVTEDTAKITGKKVIIEINETPISINKVILNLKDRPETFDIGYCMINCDVDWFKDIISHYLINGKSNQKSLVVLCDDEFTTFNGGKNDTEEFVLASDITIDADIDKTTLINFDDNSFDEKGNAAANISIDNIVIPVTFKMTTPKNSSISGIKIEQKLLSSHLSFMYRGDNKLVHGTEEYNTREELKNIIALEEKIVNKKIECGYVNDDNDLVSIEVSLNPNIINAYQDFLNYFRVNDTLPSVAYYNEDLTVLAKGYINAILQELSQLKDNTALPLTVREIMKLGVIGFKHSDMIAFSSVHPINVAYKLKMTSDNGSNENLINENVLRKFSPDNLVPFIHDKNGNLFKVQEQIQAINWIYYSPIDCKKFKGSRNFVVDLVAEKINSFYNHFKYLFENIGGKKIILSAINMGDNRNLFIGIINYFRAELKSKKANDILSIVVNVYGDADSYNTFEVLSNRAAFKKVLEEIGIKDEKDFSENEFINLVLAKLKYFRKKKSDEKFDYCHLAFIEMDAEQKIGTANTSETRSGVMIDGLMSGVTSMYYGDSHIYRTGYGSKFNPKSIIDSPLMRLVKAYNSVMNVYGSENPYNSSISICSYIDDRETDVINKTYDAANWVVFIDPKVDLNYFKNNQKDVMIIHYSDQHTTSSGYDAITVTRKTEQYQNVLREFMAKNKIPTDHNNVKKVIDMFNAFNGDWLLKLISSKSNFPKEKISIQSAIKLALAFFKNDNITWIPISLEEILRVSGAVGLDQKDGLFSAKSLGFTNGPTSDDLLMFGVEIKDKKIFVHLYPLEVKIGYENNNEISKAIQQIQSTRNIFDTTLKPSRCENDLQAKFYRNFIAQLAIISAQKLELYNIWDRQDWGLITGSDIRGRLLNDDFTISNDLRDKIGDGIIISFKSGQFARDVNYDDNVTIIKFLQSDSIDYIIKDVDEIRNDLMIMPNVKKSLFENLLKSNNVSEFNVDELNNASDQSDISEMTTSKLDDDYDSDDIDELFSKLSDEPKMVEGTEEKGDDSIDSNSDDKFNDTDDEKNSNGMKILFGSDINNGQPLYWYPNDTELTMHPNTGIIGTMGSGKTQFTKSLILQLIREKSENPGNKSIGILVFDYKGDYNESKTDFVEATGAKVFSVYRLPFNPFAIVNHNKPLMPIHIANTFADTIKRNYNLGVKQINTLFDCIIKAYEKFGVYSDEPSTWDNTAPTFEDVYNIYIDSNAHKDDSLNAALTKLHKFQVFEPDSLKTVSLYDLIDGVTVIDLQTCEESLQNLIVALTLDLFYSQMRGSGHSEIYGKMRQLTKFILVDEADNFLRTGFPSIRKILKEGREFGVGTILSTQFLDHFDTQDDDFAKYILTWIVHKVSDLTPKNIKSLFNTTSKNEEDEIISSIQKLSKSCSVVKIGNSSQIFHIEDKPFWRLMEENQ